MLLHGFRRNEVRLRFGRLQRTFSIWVPVDWWDELATNGSLAVVLMFHGGNTVGANWAESMPVSRFFGKEWRTLDGTPTAVPRKCVVIVPEGVSIDGSGGDWNSGHVGVSTRASDVDDVAYVFEVLRQVEILLSEWYAAEYEARSGVALPGSVLDKARLLLVGFSNGGQMAFRVLNAVQAKPPDYPDAVDWTATAIAVVGTAAAGWYIEQDRKDGLPVDVDWTPSPPVSVLWVQGEADARYAQWNVINGAMPDFVKDEAALQLDGKAVEDFVRADVSALESHEVMAGTWEAAPGAPLPGAPHGDLTAVYGAAYLGYFSGGEWDTDSDGTPDVAVHFYHLQGLDHTWPTRVVTAAGTWSIEDVVLDFFVRFGGLT